jgi:hypothetical protein
MKRNTKRKIGGREAITFVLAGAVLLGGVYATTRVKAREDEIKLTREEITRLTEEIAAIRPALGGNDAQSAEEELAAARVALDKLKRSLAELGTHQVDAASSLAIQDAMLGLTQLAAQHRLKLKSTATVTGGVPGMPATGNDPMQGRPLRHAVVVGRYPDLMAFLAALPKANHAATVMRFALKADAPPAGEASPLLEAEALILL